MNKRHQIILKLFSVFVCLFQNDYINRFINFYSQIPVKPSMSVLKFLFKKILVYDFSLTT